MTIQVEFWHLVGLLLSFLGFVFAGAKYLLAQQRSADDERYRQINGRIDRLEHSTRNIVTHEDLGRLSDNMNSISNKVSNMSGTMDGMDATVRLILSHITNKGAQQ